MWLRTNQWGRPLQKSLSIDGVNLWYDVIISRWRPWRHFAQKKNAATWWVHIQPLSGAYAAAEKCTYLCFFNLSTCLRRFYRYLSWCHFSYFIYFFTARQHSLLCRALIDSVRPTVWPSDRLSHAGIMPKRLQLRSFGLHWRIAPWL